MLGREMTPPEALVVGDAHVHVHACYDRTRFFDAAHANLSRAAGDASSAWHGVLLLAEAKREDFFGVARALADAGHAGRFAVSHTAEPESLLLGDGARRLLLVAGRQIACAEGLEVLALATTRHFRDGASIRETLAAVREAGAIPVVPWGAGKWLFARGRLLDALLAESAGAPLFLGDESARPALWPRPRHFARGAALGVRDLPGTDPLPFPREQTRAGSYGFRLRAPFDPQRPAASLRAALARPALAIERFGSRETLWRFVRNQIAMQQRKRARSASA